MTKRLWLQLVLLCGILIAMSSLTPRAPHTAAQSVATQQVVQPTEGPAYVVVTVHNVLMHYGSINVRAVKLATGRGETNGFNDLVQKFLDEQYASFDSAYEASKTETPVAGDTQFLGTYLSIDFKLFAWSDDLLSVRFRHSFGTHGMYRYPTAYPITYSLRDGKQLALTDLFDLASGYQAVIDSQIKRFMDQQPLTAAQKVSAAQKYTWNITPDGLVITMDDESLEWETQELPEITIPSSELRPFLKADSPLAQYWTP